MRLGGMTRWEIFCGAPSLIACVTAAVARAWRRGAISLCSVYGVAAWLSLTLLLLLFSPLVPCHLMLNSPPTLLSPSPLPSFLLFFLQPPLSPPTAFLLSLSMPVLLFLYLCTWHDVWRGYYNGG